MAIFARINHAAGAANVGLTLRPTELLIYGGAKGGTALMQIDQSFGIDLPLRTLIWEDEGGKTWVSFTRVSWLADRRAPNATAADIAARLDSVQLQMARYATSNPP